MNENDEVYDTDYEDGEYSSPRESDEEDFDKKDYKENDTDLKKIEMQINRKIKDNINLCREYGKVCLNYINENKSSKNFTTFKISYECLIEKLRVLETITETITNDNISLYINSILFNISLKKIMCKFYFLKKSYKTNEDVKNNKDQLIDFLNYIEQKMILK
tara:strand:- start:147 stop:632 length:486 start_codon:yes stop_codon:yes gene_type:complete